MNTPITVKELIASLKKLDSKGYGNFPIFISDDEEGNGFHGLWFGPEAARDMDTETAENLAAINYDLSCIEPDLRDCIIYLG